MSDVAARITQLIAEKTETPIEQITMDTALEDIEIESLDLIEIIMEVEEIYDIEIDMNAVEAWDKMNNVGDLVRTVNEFLEEKA